MTQATTTLTRAAGLHLHQVQEMAFQDGDLVPASEPRLYVSSNWDEPWSEGTAVDTAAANAFLDEQNLPPLSDLLKEAKASFQEERLVH